MWIRSQDKKMLVKVNEFEINHDYEVGNRDGILSKVQLESCRILGNGIIELGRYSTKEKALNVLDDIETYAFNHGTLGLSYQMPQEDEV